MVFCAFSPCKLAHGPNGTMRNYYSFQHVGPVRTVHSLIYGLRVQSFYMTSIIHVGQRRSWLLPSTSDQPLQTPCPWSRLNPTSKAACVCSQQGPTSKLWCQVPFTKSKTIFIPPPNEVGGGYTGFTLSVCPSVRLSVDDMVSGA